MLTRAESLTMISNQTPDASMPPTPVAKRGLGSGLHHAVYPPSMISDDPVMNEEASLSMKSAAPRYSSGVDSLFIMFSLSHSSFKCGSSSKFFLTIWAGS